MSTPLAKPPWSLDKHHWQKFTHLNLPPTITFGPWKDHPSAELAEAKTQISKLEQEGRWELVKKMVNPYEIVYTHEDKQFHPSISLIKPLSRSYFKMIEMLHVLQFFELLPKQQTKVRSAHIAEGPGGFIQAFLQLCQTHKRTVVSATAMTLKPNSPCVPGWKRATAFLNRHSQIQIHHGEDGTGDVYLEANQRSFIRACKPPGVALFTADGGFDFSINYNVQEERVYHLLVSSALTGLQTLASEGHFVMKLFDIASEHSKFLILLLSQCFREWILYKPALSRPCNSERYFMGRGMRILDSRIIDLLHQLQACAADNQYPVDTDAFFPAAVKEYIDDHIRQIQEEQIRSIQQAVIYANQPEVWYTTQLPIDLKKSIAWCQRFHVPYLAPP